MDYGELIGEAFRIAWRNRYLWLFGFFIGGGVGSLKLGIPPNPDGAGGNPNWLLGLAQWVRENVALAVVLGVGLLVLILLVFLALWIVSAGGLADTVAALHAGERSSFAQTLRAGVSNARRVFLNVALFSLIGLVPVVVIGGLAALCIFGIFSGADSEMLRVVFITLSIPVAMVLLLVVYVPLYFVQQLALRELVIGGGYRLLRRNPGRVMAAWLVQLVIAIAVVVVVYIVGTIVGLTQAFGFLALSSSMPYPLALTLALVTGLIVSLPFAVVAALVGVYNHAYWTLAYLRLVALSTDPLPTAERDSQTND